MLVYQHLISLVHTPRPGYLSATYRHKSTNISAARLGSLCNISPTYQDSRNLGYSWNGKLLTTACESHVLLRTLSVVYNGDGPGICGFCGDGRDDGCMRLQDFVSLGWDEPSFHMVIP